MGLGTVQDLIEGVARGMDVFDCVLPTRLARHHSALTHEGRLNLLRSAYRRDARPIESECHCYTCQHFSRGYLRHLVQAREMLAATLLSIHNLHLLMELTREMREAIRGGRFGQMISEWRRVESRGAESRAMA